ncbi:hypothetical protein BCEP4_480047 [Burkholderia cepacia]|nr:hypothetical protein BCEP4_480047 [Burkholderia cepacia]
MDDPMRRRRPGFRASGAAGWSQGFACSVRRAGREPGAASRRGFRTAFVPSRRHPHRASFPCHFLVAGFFRARNTGAKKRPYNCHRTSSNRVFFHMMRRRFTQVFVASKALNHLQLSLTIARIC